MHAVVPPLPLHPGPVKDVFTPMVRSAPVSPAQEAGRRRSAAHTAPARPDEVFPCDFRIGAAAFDARRAALHVAVAEAATADIAADTAVMRDTEARP
ncbi:hypothetical protein [Pikeienuella sp. HZG-20]|uniref:hypothetical protein n=1 Tax=Paludibacillus litoralis TaxID=3133267 RepID=UPI0030EC10F0